MNATSSAAMKRVRERRAGAIILVLLIVSFIAGRAGVAATMAEPSHFVVGAVPEAIPPLELSDPKQTVRGVSADFAQQIASALQRPLEWRTYPNRTAMIEELGGHEIDAATNA